MNPVYKFWLGVRATVFWVGFAASILLAGLLVQLLWLAPKTWRYWGVTLWNCFAAKWLHLTCGVGRQVWGLENLPQNSAFILMSNHQSTWETLALPCIVPQHMSWVLKRELLKIPFFGWGLHLIRPIAIDRSAGRAAVKQIAHQGKALLEDGVSIVIFPEGTRVAPGEKVPYKIGGFVLAAHAGYPVVPVAHNAGESWRRHSYIKYPGTITVSIGKPIATAGLKADAIQQQVEAWIESEKARLPAVGGGV